jgi:peptidoglycan LD-endopeptidase LytH
MSRASLGRPRGRTVSATTAVVVLLALLAAGPVRADTKTDLANAKKRLAQLEKEVDAAQAQQDRLQAEADAIAAQIAQTSFAIGATEDRIQDTEVGINRREARLVYLQNRLSMRARDAYIKGPGGIFEVIFGASSFGDLSDRLALYDSVQQSDSDLAAKVEGEREALEERRDNLGVLRAKLRAQQSEQELALELQTSKLSQMSRIVDRLADKRHEAAGLVSILGKKLKDEAARARALASGGGAIVGTGIFRYCPVDSPNSFSDDFGAPRVGHYHAGNDVFAPYGTPIRAPFDGVASNASNSLGGLSVYVHGASGYVYNAHLSRFGTLGSVNAGTIVGYVGNTGNARYTPPHDHFEWHPNAIPPSPHTSPYGYSVIGSAIDPYPYLIAACR